MEIVMKRIHRIVKIVNSIGTLQSKYTTPKLQNFKMLNILREE